MARVGQLYYNVIVNGANESNIEDIKAKNIIEGKIITKLGIQAPAGTRAYINNKTILIGRTGIYELDDDILINSISFVDYTNNAQMNEDIENIDNNGLGNIIIDFIQEGS